MQKIKVFGERNTGTNYLVQMLSRNCKVELFPSVVPGRLPLRQKEFMKDLYFAMAFKRTMGWKHAVPNLSKIQKHPALAQTQLLTLSKNPYSFLLSLYKRPYHYKGVKPATFTDFLRKPWEVRGRDNHSGSQFESPIALWNEKNRSYRQLKEALGAKVTHLNYETLLADPVQFVTDLATSLQLTLKNETVTNVEKSAKGEKKGFTDYKAYYLGEEWKQQLSAEDIQFINAGLDKEVVAYFGYELI